MVGDLLEKSLDFADALVHVRIVQGWFPVPEPALAWVDEAEAQCNYFYCESHARATPEGRQQGERRDPRGGARDPEASRNRREDRGIDGGCRPVL